MLDQGQTIKIGETDVNFNLITFDKMNAERMAKLPAGTAVFRIDHQLNEAKSTARHLVQLSLPTYYAENKERGNCTVNLTVNTNGVCSDADVVNTVNGILLKVPGILTRVLMNES